MRYFSPKESRRITNTDFAISALSPGQLLTIAPNCFYFVLHAPKNSSHRVEPKIPSWVLRRSLFRLPLAGLDGLRRN